MLICTEKFREDHAALLRGKDLEVETCKPSELERLGSLQSNDAALAVARMKEVPPPSKLSGLTLALDTINDPGNLGALLRIADWYGVKTVAASENTADFYNPKVLQASMGSFCRVRIHYVALELFLKGVSLPVLAAVKGGKSAHSFPFPKDCVILLGSESHGISPGLLSLAKDRIGIPSYGPAESLNVAMAAAVLCDNYRRSAGS